MNNPEFLELLARWNQFAIFNPVYRWHVSSPVAKEPFRAKIRGKDAAHLIVTKDQGNTDDVQAMTGATISSRAVTRGVKSAVAAVSSYLADGGR